MDMDKLKQWLEIAQGMQGGDFWKNVFDQEFAREFVNEKAKDSFFTGNPPQKEKDTKTFPVIDLLENNEEVVVVIEVPGVPKEDIQLGLSGQTLTIKGTIKPVYQHLNLTYNERFYGDFQRQIKLPDVIKPQDLVANFWNGVLLIKYTRPQSDSISIQID